MHCIETAKRQAINYADKSRIEIYILPKYSNILQNLDPLQYTWIKYLETIWDFLKLLFCSLGNLLQILKIVLIMKKVPVL